ncbi:MAG: MraY family glycosyltransferase [Verrucomicrobiota bacterium]
MIWSLLFFAGSFAICFFMTAFVLKFWPKHLGVDKPDKSRKKHSVPVLRVGGLPIYIIFVASVLLLPFFRDTTLSQWSSILLTSSLIFVLGFADDFKPIGAKFKLLGQVVIACVAYFLGLSIAYISYPVGNISLSLGAWGLVITIFWFISVPNIINLIDGVDGLAAGLGFFLYLTLGYIAWSGGAHDVSLISFAVAGALLGFLCFNFPPARIFLGDGGAYFIGFGIAALSLKSSQKGSVAAILLVTIIALGLPIVDTTFAILRRGLRGFPLFRPDAEHIHHRLKRIGFSEKNLVLVMYLITVFFSLMALSVFWSKGRTLPIAVGVIFLMVVLAIRQLGYVWSWSYLTLQIRQSMERRDSVRYVLLYSKIAELELLRSSSLEDFRVWLEDTMKRCGFEIQPPEEIDNYQEIVLEFREYAALRLWGPAGSDDRDHYYRLAGCFREVYEQACAKWEVEGIFLANDREV